MSKLIRLAISGAAVVAFTVTAFSAGPASAKVHSSAVTGTVAFLGPEQFTGRWVKDAAYFNAELHKLGPKITIKDYNANASISTQQQNLNSALGLGAKVIVLAAVDQNQDAPLVDQAEAAGAKVLAYDRMIQSPKLRAYDSFDNVGVGIEQGTWFKANVKKGTIVEIRGSTTDQNAHLFYMGFCKVVCPLIKKKTYKLCYSTWTPNWVPATAGTEMDSAFTKCGSKLAGIYSMNDGMAAAVYQSEVRHHVRLPLTGQDAQPDGLGRILEHQQGMTVFKFVKSEAVSAAQVAYNWLAGKNLPSNYKHNCGADCVQASGRHVPAALFTPISINLKAHNVGKPVSTGFDTWADVCASIGKPTSPYCGLPH
ncbi:MAG TPA: substrate-binding domain-containing protein [Chloroflexota bacterium]|jgi:D-xylose transport system substrate-binding protein|nr:substrate-binding domain-containing protein [Chloroflexota bacterium]